MKIIYIYHSGFAIETENLSIVIDYYKDSEDANKAVLNKHILQGTLPLYVLSSHGHYDHYNPQILDWKNRRDNVKYIFSKDILDSGLAKASDACYLDKDGVFEDDLIKIKAFGSTDLGISFKITIGNQTIFHGGDLNNWHWKEESSAQESAKAEQFYLDELQHLALETPRIDIAMFAVDPRLGKEYMLGAQQFIDTIPTGLFIPMHFDQAYSQAAAIGVFAEKKNTAVFIPNHEGAAIDL